VPVQQLATTEQYLAVLGGHPTKFPPGERFSYCNGGFVVLALIAERASGTPFHDLVEQRVCGPAGLADTEFLRSDDLPGRAALGYVDVDGVTRSNVLHLPVRGSGDGGIYSTVADVRTLWTEFFAGNIVPARWVDEMVRPRDVFSDTSSNTTSNTNSDTTSNTNSDTTSDTSSNTTSSSARYGLGFWLAASGDSVRLEGYDAGVSFRSWHDPTSSSTETVVSNTSEGAWPMARALRARLHG
ncbi:MAG TPA: serine hydrolase domain-containing protein, partial [Ilumatobacteraceae bacterium]